MVRRQTVAALFLLAVFGCAKKATIVPASEFVPPQNAADVSGVRVYLGIGYGDAQRGQAGAITMAAWSIAPEAEVSVFPRMTEFAFACPDSSSCDDVVQRILAAKPTQKDWVRLEGVRKRERRAYLRRLRSDDVTRRMYDVYSLPATPYDRNPSMAASQAVMQSLKAFREATAVIYRVSSENARMTRVEGRDIPRSVKVASAKEASYTVRRVSFASTEQRDLAFESARRLSNLRVRKPVGVGEAALFFGVSEPVSAKRFEMQLRLFSHLRQSSIPQKSVDAIRSRAEEMIFEWPGVPRLSQSEDSRVVSEGSSDRARLFFALDPNVGRRDVLASQVYFSAVVQECTNLDVRFTWEQHNADLVELSAWSNDRAALRLLECGIYRRIDESSISRALRNQYTDESLRAVLLRATMSDPFRHGLAPSLQEVTSLSVAEVRAAGNALRQRLDRFVVSKADIAAGRFLPKPQISALSDDGAQRKIQPSLLRRHKRDSPLLIRHREASRGVAFVLDVDSHFDPQCLRYPERVSPRSSFVFDITPQRRIISIIASADAQAVHDLQYVPLDASRCHGVNGWSIAALGPPIGDQP